jgi:hypothetical protein
VLNQSATSGGQEGTDGNNTKMAWRSPFGYAVEVGDGMLAKGASD